MGGFSAINAANGWLIAALGISVVFFGLLSLAFIVSYFPRMIAWWNAHAKAPKYFVPWVKSLISQPLAKPTSSKATVQSVEPGELDDAEEALRLLTAHMGEPFKLPRLIEVAEQRGLARVHSTINGLLIKGTMVGGPDGLFRWAIGSERKSGPQGVEVSRGST
ncbi:MAG: OadG family protein [Deltaproteobacteria bacterium]|nr:MAG: OadG family protein [Deltaproteobacteria bacterium]